MRVAYVLFEGLPATVIDSQVMRHIRVMHELHGVEFEVFSFACTEAGYRSSLSRLEAAREASGARVSVLEGVRPALPGSHRLNGHRVLAALRSRAKPPDLLHARTDYSTLCAKRATRQLGVPLLWDCRGDSAAEFRFRWRGRDNALNRPILSFRERSIQREFLGAAAACDGAMFVSGPLQKSAAPCLADRPTRIVPCLADESLFFYDEALRVETRGALGFTPDRKVFIYAGSLTAYQCVDETVALFRALHEQDPGCHLLFLTPEVDTARALLAGLPADAVTLRAAKLPEMNAYLNAADAGFMLRERLRLNEVASPTKFAEYVLTGLPVVMTDAVADSHALALELGLWLEPSAESVRRAMAQPRSRAETASAAVGRLGRRALSREAFELYEATAVAAA